MALARGSCVQGTHAPASTGSCLAGSLRLRVPCVRLQGSTVHPSVPSWTLALVWCPGARTAEGPRAQTPFSCPQGKCQPCCPGNRY